MRLVQIEVRAYEPDDQAGVDRMMEGIAAEFAEAVTGPQSVRLHEAYQKPGQRFWVALDGDTVVGTVGLTLLSDGNAVLKRMMIARAYRGTTLGLASRMLRTAADWGRSRGCTTIYLGTMGQFTAAQRFYAKHGCDEISLESLPSDFAVNPIDEIHYRLRLR